MPSWWRRRRRGRVVGSNPWDFLWARPCAQCPHNAGWHRWLVAESGPELQADRRRNNCHECPCPHFVDGLVGTVGLERA